MVNIIENIINEIKKNKTFILTTHINPDGDAIGSELALARFLKNLGKSVRIINHSPTPDYLQFMLNNVDEIEVFNETKHSDIIKNTDIIFALDFNHLSRTVSLENFIRNSSALKICIDHHEFPEDFANIKLVNSGSSSTGELIYKLLKPNIDKLTYEIALPLYVAIMTDTGSFRYERTTAELHRITAELLDAGVIPIKVHQEIFEQGSANRLKLLGRALNSLTIVANGKLAYIKVSRNDLLETETSEEDVEGFVNYTLSIKGVEVGLFFFELQEGFKISFRSSGNIAVNKLASEFGGGGHMLAAGARVPNKQMEKTIPSIIETAEKYFK